MRKHHLRAVAAAAVLTAVPLAGCSSSSSSGAVALRLGFLPNLTHASALVGVENGLFTKALGSGVRLTTTTFNAGPAEVTALFSDALDAAYLGPNSAISAFTQSNGAAIVVVSGATSGGAELVVQPSITAPAQLKGTTLASPQLGNTQDVALRTWLAGQGLTTTAQGGGDVTIEPQANATAVQAFQTGAIAGGWEPEPYASQMVKAGGHVLVDERSLWPNGQFATTVLAVRKAYLQAHPATVKALIEGQVQANELLNQQPAAAQTAANAELTSLTGKPVAAAVLALAWPYLTFTDDPIAASFATDVQHAVAAGTGKAATLTGLFDLTLLNQVLVADGHPAVPTT